MAVRAPLPGTFYRAPRPGAAPFVEVGSRVSADTVVGIVETMKLMNSVHAGVAGTVAEICVAERRVRRARGHAAAHPGGSMILRRVLVANRGRDRRPRPAHLPAPGHRDRAGGLGRRRGLGAGPAGRPDDPDRAGAARPRATSTSTRSSRAAVAAGADAIHPGYGFLSENPRLARACEAAGIVFIGPSADVLEAAGDKLAARSHAVAAGLPVLPGGLVRAAGTGGRGGRGSGAAGWRRRGAEAGPRRGRGQAGRADRVSGAGQGGGGRRGAGAAGGPRSGPSSREAVAVASAEAQAAFGDPRVYLERYVSPARHVEVQLLGDGENVIHLGDRDCSVQRRYQKLIEEAPAPRLGETLRAGCGRRRSPSACS